MTPEVSLAFSVTLANPLLLWLACLADITALSAGMLGSLAVFQDIFITLGIMAAAGGGLQQS